MTDLPTTPGSVIEAKPPGRKKAFRMALREDGRWQRLDGPFEERGPFREVRVLFDAEDGWLHQIRHKAYNEGVNHARAVFGRSTGES